MGEPARGKRVHALHRRRKPHAAHAFANIPAHGRRSPSYRHLRRPDTWRTAHQPLSPLTGRHATGPSRLVAWPPSTGWSGRVLSRGLGDRGRQRDGMYNQVDPTTGRWATTAWQWAGTPGADMKTLSAVDSCRPGGRAAAAAVQLYTTGSACAAQQPDHLTPVRKCSSDRSTGPRTGRRSAGSTTGDQSEDLAPEHRSVLHHHDDLRVAAQGGDSSGSAQTTGRCR